MVSKCWTFQFYQLLLHIFKNKTSLQTMKIDYLQNKIQVFTTVADNNNAY